MLPLNTPIEIWWQDKSGLDIKPRLRDAERNGAPDPERPWINGQCGPGSLAHLCPARSIGVALVLPRCNMQAMQWHLDEITTQVSPCAHAILLVDQAGWHTTGKLAIPTNITLLLLPPRSPEPTR